MYFIPAAADNPVTGHNPSKNRSVLFNSLGCIGRAGGVHGASIAVYDRDVILIEFDEYIFSPG